MQQPVHAAQINKGTIIGDVFHNPFHLLTFQQIGHDFIARFGACLFHNGAARDDNIAAAAVHFQNLERLRRVHQWGDVTDRANIDLAARQKCRCAVQIDGETAFDTAENNPFDALIGFEIFLQLDPAFFAARLVARQHGFAHCIFNAVDKNFDLIAYANLSRLTGHRKFTQRHAAFGFQADINNRQIIFNGGDATAHYRAFNRCIGGKAFFQKRGEIISAWVHTRFSILFRHACVSLIVPNPAL